MKSIFFIGAGIAFFTGLTSCGNSDFKGSTGTPNKKQDQPAIANREVTEVFTLDASKRPPLDLVWTIDNSGSMTDKIEQVRKNFDAFMASLASAVDVKVILISRASGPNSLTLPKSATGGVQINSTVGSWDAAEQAVFASCPPALTLAPIKATPCGVSIMGDAWGGPTAVAGKAVSHFRSGAVRNYVFVTDDESKDITGDEFVNVIKASGAPALPKVYSFRGTPQSKCRVSAVGMQYGTMETSTGGKSFDICETNWTAYFSELAATITENVSGNITLKGPVDPESIQVYLDGKLLTNTDYTVTGLQIVLKTPPDLSRSREVKVVYKKPKA